MRYAALVLAFCLAGCVTTEHATGTLQTNWQGKRFDAFVQKHGAPKSTHRMADGRTVYDWESRYQGTTITGTQVNATCAARFTVRGGVIESVEATQDTLGRFNVSRCAEVLGSA